MKKFLNFETLITPALLKILYPTLVVLYLIKYFWQMVTTMFSFNIFGLSASFTALVYFLTIPFILRIVFEFVLAVFRIYEYTFKLANPDTELKGIVNCLSELKKEANHSRPNMQQQAQNFNFNPQNQPNQFNQNQAYGQGYTGQPQQGFNQAPTGFHNSPQPQAPYYQGQPQNFGAQPNQPVQPNQPTQPMNDTSVNPNGPQN